MATATKICKVCGKEYPYCRTERRVAGVFRWQDVACSVEHGSIYLERILASRNGEPESRQAEEVAEVVKEKSEDIGETVATPVVTKKSRKTSAKSAQ